MTLGGARGVGGCGYRLSHTWGLIEGMLMELKFERFRLKDVLEGEVCGLEEKWR